MICVCLFDLQYVVPQNRKSTFFFHSSFKSMLLQSSKSFILFQIALFLDFVGALCNLEYVIILCVCTYPNNHWTTSIYQTVPSSAGLNQKFPNFEPRFISTLKPNFLLSQYNEFQKKNMKNALCLLHLSIIRK